MSAPFDIVAKWRATQAWVQEDPALPPGALKVLLRLLEHQNSKTGQCNPSVSTLARAIHISERGVRYAIRELKTRGAIEVLRQRGSRSNHYRIKFPDRGSSSGGPMGRKPSSPKPEAGFRSGGKPAAAKTINKRIKKKRAYGDQVELVHPQSGRKRNEDAEALLENRAQQEARFHDEITARLELLGMAYEDLVYVDSAFLSAAFEELVATPEHREKVIEKVVRACRELKREGG